jgi:hypothetical protein
MIAELRSLVEQIAIDQPTPAKKFLFEMIFGLCASGSVLLTEVGRKLPATISLHAVEKRLSRQLGSERWDDGAMLERYVRWAARAIKADTVLALDTSDIRKAYAELLEKLSEGGEEGQCGWLKDKYGLSWQVVPPVLSELLGSAQSNSIKSRY